MRRLTHLLVLSAFIFSCGGQWYALQCVAWVKMIHDYSQIVPVSEAVSMTFSGQHPCALCHAISNKKEPDHGNAFAVEKYEKKFFPPLELTTVFPAPTLFHYAEFSDSVLTRSEAPPTPPPRLA